MAFAPVSPGYVYVKIVATDELGAEMETGFPVFIEHRTGIDDNYADAIRIYPNPVTDVLNLSLNGVKADHYQVVDIKGSVVMLMGSLDNMHGQTINTDRLQPGIYMLKLYSDDNVIIKKFTKQ